MTRPEETTMKFPRIAAAIVAFVLLAGACSSDETGGDAAPVESTSTTEATTTSPEATSTTEPTTETTIATDDRTTTTGVNPSAPFEPPVCAEMFEALEALTLPVEGTDDFGTQLDEALATVDEATAAAPGYTADQFAKLRDLLAAARPAIEGDGYAGWQAAIVASRTGDDEADIEVQLENVRSYVLPRC